MSWSFKKKKSQKHSIARSWGWGMGWLLWFNSSWPSDVIWRQGSRSTLAQVMACCLTAPSHYLNQGWLMISKVLWHSPDSNFTENTHDIYCWNEFEIYQFETVVKSPRGQWVNIVICNLGLYSLSSKMTHLQILWSLEAARLDNVMIVSFRNLTGISAAALPRCLSNIRAIGKV